MQPRQPYREKPKGAEKMILLWILVRLDTDATLLSGKQNLWVGKKNYRGVFG